MRTCDGVVVRASLQPGEDRLVDEALQVVECFLARLGVHAAGACGRGGQGRSPGSMATRRALRAGVVVVPLQIWAVVGTGKLPRCSQEAPDLPAFPARAGRSFNPQHPGHGGSVSAGSPARSGTFAVEDHAGPAAPQGLVGGGGDDVAVVEGGGHHAGNHQPADVGHVGHEIGTVGVGDLPHAGVVQVARVAADTCRETARGGDGSRCSRTLGQAQAQPDDGDSTQAPASVDVFVVSSWHRSIRGRPWAYQGAAGFREPPPPRLCHRGGQYGLEPYLL